MKIEVTDAGYYISSIHLDGKRVGSIWKNKDGSVSIKVDPKIWDAPWKISETEGHAFSFETLTLIRPLESTARSEE